MSVCVRCVRGPVHADVPTCMHTYKLSHGGYNLQHTGRTTKFKLDDEEESMRLSTLELCQTLKVWRFSPRTPILANWLAFVCSACACCGRAKGLSVSHLTRFSGDARARLHPVHGEQHSMAPLRQICHHPESPDGSRREVVAKRGLRHRRL